MFRTVRLALIAIVAVGAMLATLASGPVVAQDAPPPENPPPVAVDLPCAGNIEVQVLGRTSYDEADDIALVRIIWGPDGYIDAHTHPAVMWVTVESGQFGLTLIEEGEMSVTRAATADAEAAVEQLEPGVEVVLEAGDGFKETGMIHSARNMSSTEAMSTIFAAVVETGQPITICVDMATPIAGTGGQGSVR
jgi:hypothetical protein